MDRIAAGSTDHLQDVAAFADTVAQARELFDDKSEIYITRAPGRLDLMGGIADYSGSLVLEMPIAEAALAAVQKIKQRVLQIVSLSAEENNRTSSFEMPLDDFERDGKPVSYAAAQSIFKRDQRNGWAAYIAGAFLVLMREKHVHFDSGAKILIDSKVPEGKGVSSSAAIEVAVMSAVAAAYSIVIERQELALLCQQVENLIVGAPCGIMDQLSTACGAENKLLSIICQPAEVRGAISIPGNLAVWGIDSGVRHSVGSGDYGSVRIGAFVGYRIIADLAGLKVHQTKTKGVVKITDEKWGGYLANITPEEFERNYAAQLPREISGAQFLAKYKGITDTVTKVSPDKTYQVLNPTAHPVYENFRVNKFAKLLNEQMNKINLDELGKLMYQSHESYSSCGLGTGGTDLLVELVAKSEKLYGARITGGGSGGTVAVLGAKGADEEIQKIAERYERKTGYRPRIFSGSSPGAAEFGHLKLKLN